MNWTHTHEKKQDLLLPVQASSGLDWIRLVPCNPAIGYKQLCRLGAATGCMCKDTGPEPNLKSYLLCVLHLVCFAGGSSSVRATQQMQQPRSSPLQAPTNPTHPTQLQRLPC
jgi:hypothetical protein